MAFDNSPFRYGAQAPGYAGTQVDVDQGLRSFMLGVYNNMVVGLGISGLVALGLNMASVASSQSTAAGRIGNVLLTQTGVMLYGSPLKWVLMFAPLLFIFVFSMRMDRMSAASARTMFFVFAAVMGASLSSLSSVGAAVVAALSSSSPPPQAANASTPAATMTKGRRVVMVESSHPSTPPAME